MSGYTKLFGSILDSTVWETPPAIRVVWITMLAMVDGDGVVEASVPGLAKRAGVSRAECEQALALFSAPDPDSRTKTLEGRRIVEVAGGWRLVNHELYRRKLTAEERRERDAERKRRKRASETIEETSRTSADSPQMSAMSEMSEVSLKILHAEAEAEAEAEADQIPPTPQRGVEENGPRSRVVGPDEVTTDYLAGWQKHRGKKPPPERVGLGGGSSAAEVARQVTDREELARALEAFWRDYTCQKRRSGKLSALADHYRRLADDGPADEYGKPLDAKPDENDPPWVMGPDGDRMYRPPGGWRKQRAPRDGDLVID